MESTVSTPHNAVLEDRAKLSLTGVTQVDSFDDQEVVCRTSRGNLTVRGHGLRIDKLNAEGGALQVQGTVDALEYQEPIAVKSGGFFTRLFR